ncbi:unnamed protein product [Moneuplotes crassus]|uniref:Uncharacterized protein n=1 Tax=Euplotes crassus TaxID=5936 RepID=A0AAD2D442_EUPCR|nr:unnamed protein product [Moneuplotes crassus]
MLSKVLFRKNLGHRYFSYSALIRKYPERAAVVDSLDRRNEEKPTFHAKMRHRIGYFFRSKRRRFLYFIFGALLFQLFDNILKLTGSRAERNFKILKRMALNKVYPEILNCPSSLRTHHETETLSQKTEKELGQRFVEIDQMLAAGLKIVKPTEASTSSSSAGLTRAMLIECIKNIGKHDDKIEHEFLNKSSYTNLDDKLNTSCTLQEFYELIALCVTEDPQTGVTDELLVSELLLRELDKIAFMSTQA